MSSFYLINDVQVPPRFRLFYGLPDFDLPQTSASDARWVILPCPLLVYARNDVVKPLCDKYGKDRLVLFDYSDHGHGDYPCTVFAQNTKHEFPKNVLTYLHPLQKRMFDGKLENPPTRSSLEYDVSFCGDATSHPMRARGIELFAELKPHRGFLKANAGGFLENNDPAEGDYWKSFQTRLMWCPPSRRPVTSRMLEAINDGVPVLTAPLWEQTRLDRHTDFIKGTNVHGWGMENFLDAIKHCLADPELEERALILRRRFLDYQNNFWRIVALQLSKL